MKFVRLLIFAGLAASHAFGTSPRARAEDSRRDTQPLWLVSNGFHSALGFRMCDIDPALRKLAPDSRARWWLIGWGNAEFFTADHATIPLIFNAVFIPSPSALHVVPLRKTFAARFPHSDVIRLEIPRERMGALCTFLLGSLARDARGAPISFARGHFPSSRFYRGRDRFYFPKMCNVWTAQALRRAGVPIFVPSTMVANDLVWQTARHGHREGWKRFPVEGF